MGRHNHNQIHRDAALAGGSTGPGNVLYDAAGNITFSSGATPPTTANMYAIGSIFVQNDATTPSDGVYINNGTVASPTFVPIGSLGNYISIAVPVLASDVDKFVWIAPFAVNFISATCVYSAAVGTAATLAIRKITANAQAPGAAAGASVVELISGTFDLNTTVNTVQTKLANVVPVASGNRIAFDFSAALGTLAGCVVTLNFTTA